MQGLESEVRGLVCFRKMNVLEWEQRVSTECGGPGEWLLVHGRRMVMASPLCLHDD